MFSLQIPDQKCREYPIKLPKKIPKEECHTHPREECKKIPKQVPRQVAEKVPRYYCDDHHETLEHFPERVTRYSTYSLEEPSSRRHNRHFSFKSIG